MSVALQSSDPPAEAAARVLIRLGLAILFVALPCTGIFWRGAIYVLLPVGATLILLGAMLDAPRHGGRKLRGALVSPAGGAALFLAFWACLSLIWTPFPEEATDRFLKSAVTTVLAVLVAVYLPQKTKTLDLYLLPAGLAVASVATLALALFGTSWFLGGFEFDETLFERSMITAIVLVWPALGILSFREHWISAAILAVLVAAVALAGFAQIALLATGAGAFTFAVAMSGPARTARVLAWVFGSLILFAPALPFLYEIVLKLAGFEAGAGSAPMLIWRDLIVSQWPRLVTGHGFDFVHQGLSFGYLPERAPRSLLFVVWSDLGLAGAAGFMVLVVHAFRSAGAIPAKAAPALLAGLVAILTISFLGIATAQIWWVTLLDCNVIAFAILLKGIDKAQRPDAQTIRAIETEAPQESMQGRAAVSEGSAATL
ncbi:MAG TPA: hypothetical protein VMU78_04090 [Methylocella sp.]|nr:hypothetical protein [Methylocella sp.]